ncbi:MAG: hypothetical protein H0X42_07330 [Solirubrobacterales bacterium]|nr:hypothetical protein [Solirubrobacterales bacterium]
MRLATPLAIAVLAAALLAGCGSSSSSPAGSTATGSTGSKSAPSTPAGASAQACAIDATGVTGLRVTAVSCGQGQKTAIAWQRDAACSPATGGSEAGCTVGAYRCIATTTDRGYSVSCAEPGRSVAFTAKRG